MIETIIIPLIGFAFQIYFLCIFVFVIMSWFPNVRESPLGEWLEKVVGPYLQPFRKLIPPIGVIDISPLVALFTLYFAEKGLVEVIRWITETF
ncbi:YggT family protein [Bacillaceae bacterium]